MTSSRPLLTAVCLLLCSVGLASAQVLRCEDAKGRITYTDGSCPSSQASQEVVPALSADDKAAQEARYDQALQRKRLQQAQQAEREAAQRQAEAERAAAQPAPQPPPTVVVVPAPEPVVVQPSYRPMYPPPRPPHVRPPPRPPAQPAPGSGYNCNVFRCYDNKGNTWSRP